MMKYFENSSVLDVMKVTGLPLNEKQVGSVVKNVLCGLEYLHEKGFVHRDIKSANILLDSEGSAAIGDFGSALNKSATASAGGGTLCFLAPETIEMSMFSVKSDIYALGIACIEMAEKSPPNIEMSQEKLALKILMEESPTLSNKTQYTVHFNNFIATCLEKDHNKRPDTLQLSSHPFINYTKHPKETMPPLLEAYSKARFPTTPTSKN